MKPTNLKNGGLLLAFFSIVLAVGLVSWGQKQSPGKYGQPNADTVPQKTKEKEREKKIRDLDDVIDELDRVDIKANMENVQKELTEAMKKFDGDKIKMEIDKAMQEVDIEKIKKEVENSFSKVDIEKVKEELSRAMKQIDAAKIQQEIQESMTKVDWEKIKAEMEKVKDIDMQKITEEMKKVGKEMEEMGPKLKKELENAQLEIEKAKIEMKEYKAFVDGLNDDGLINKKGNYTLKHKDGELFINGKKASDATYNKYRSFLDKHKKFRIEKGDDDFDIDRD